MQGEALKGNMNILLVKNEHYQYFKKSEEKNLSSKLETADK